MQEKLSLISPSTYTCWFQCLCQRLFSSDPEVLLIMHMTLCYLLWCVTTFNQIVFLFHRTFYTTVRKDRFSQLLLSWANMEMNRTSLQQYKDICVCTYKQKHHSCQQSWQIVCRCLWPRHLAPHDPVSLSENETLYHLDFYLPLTVYFSWKKR